MSTRSGFWVLGSLIVFACSGSTSNDGRRDPETLIADVCDKIAGMSCPNGFSESECDAEIHEERAEAVGDGCGAEFDAVMACYLEHLTGCEQNGPDICPAQVDAADECMNPGGGDECSMGMGGHSPGQPTWYQSCDIDCLAWGASCKTPTSPTLVCTCTHGPSAGKTFSPASCQEFTLSAGELECG